MLSDTVFEYHSKKNNSSKSEILNFLENILIDRIRRFDSLLEKSSKDIERLKTNIVVAEFQISQKNLIEIRSRKETLKKDVSDLIKMTLSLENNSLNSALYLLVNKINKIISSIDSYNVDYFNYTGGLQDELKYFKQILTKNNRSNI